MANGMNFPLAALSHSVIFRPCPAAQKCFSGTIAKMTAEIAVMNKHAVALAADSAVTIQHRDGQKIYNTANKLFALSSRCPVGVMVYGSAELMSVPWETVIRVYQDKIQGRKFNKLEDYAKHFFSFLNRKNPLFPQSEQDKNFQRTISGYFMGIRQTIDKTVGEEIAKNGKADKSKIFDIANAVIQEYYLQWEQAKKIKHFPKNHRQKIAGRYRGDISFSIKKRFEKLPISPSAKNKLRKMAIDIFCKDLFPENFSGIVIAGFGERETFPSVCSYQVDCVINNSLKFSKFTPKCSRVHFNNTATVVPFAQEDVVHTFVEGTDPIYQRKVNAFLSKILGQYRDEVVNKINLKKSQKLKLSKALRDFGNKVEADFIARLDEHRLKNHIEPLLSVIEVLPKDELAAMAESLVNLTSLKRKMSLGVETVGGPIDVAIISKGEGLIWIKRKHYFKKELNPHFFTKYGVLQ
jgi:hypothetical protein